MYTIIKIKEHFHLLENTLAKPGEYCFVDNDIHYAKEYSKNLRVIASTANLKNIPFLKIESKNIDFNIVKIISIDENCIVI